MTNERESTDVADIAVIISARNEERTIESAVTGALARAGRVVVMDGHSSDRTAAIATAAGAVVQRDPGRGKGSAIRFAIDTIDAPILVFMDADGSHDPADIPRLVAPLTRGEAELCVGSRFAGGSEELSVTLGQLIRTVGNISMNLAINWRFGVALTDTLNGYRAGRSRVLRQIALTEDIHTIEQEMVMKTLRHGHRVVNVPTHEYARLYGQSHIAIWRQWPRFVWCVARNLVASRVPRPADQG